MSTPILICDDSGFARRQMARSLPDSWDVDISFAENGEQALTLIREGKGDVVFLDLNMPVMDGYQATKEIRQHESNSNRRVPICALTANTVANAKQQCLEAGMDDFISKPFKDHELVKVLNKWLG